MPFHAQENKNWAGFTPAKKALEFCKLTCESLTAFDKIIVCCQNELDYSSLQDLTGNVEAIYIEGYINPLFLSYYTVSYLQNICLDYDYVYYTESDQILHCNIWSMLETFANDDIYIAPHRLDRVPKEKLEARLERFNTPRGFVVDFESDYSNEGACVISNHPLVDEDICLINGFYKNQSIHSAYGGAWFATKKLFVDTEFLCKPPLGENIGGHCLFNKEGVMCLKSSLWREFFVEHLSSYYANKEMF